MKHLRRFNESLTIEYAPIFTEFLEEDLGVVVIFDLVKDWEDNGAEVYYFGNDQMNGVQIKEMSEKVNLVKELLTAGLVAGLQEGVIMDNPSKVICLVYNPNEPDVQTVLGKIVRKCGKVSTSERTGSWGDDSLGYTKELILIF